MSDDFLSRLREEPRPEFAERLERRLREIDESERERRLAPGPWRRFAPALAGVSLAAALAFAFTLEPVRAAAREFLDLFRVKRFAAVPVDPQRLARLAKGGLDFKSARRRPGAGRGRSAAAGGRGQPRGRRGRGRHHRPAARPSCRERTELAETKLGPAGQPSASRSTRASSRRSPSPRAPTRSRSPPSGTARRSTSRCRRCWACATRARSRRPTAGPLARRASSSSSRRSRRWSCRRASTSRPSGGSACASPA